MSIRALEGLTDEDNGRFSFRGVGPYQLMRFTTFRSVLSVVGVDDLVPTRGRLELRSEPLRSRSVHPCRRAFRFGRTVDEYSVPGSTALLLTENVVLTAAHSLGKDISAAVLRESKRFVFRDLAQGVTDRPIVTRDRVLEPIEVLDAEYDSGDFGLDWAVVRVADHTRTRCAALHSCGVRIGDGPGLGESVWYAGHPGGVRLKTEDGRVLPWEAPAGMIVASMDVIGGASGSPVFDQHGRLTGVLRGLPFEWEYRDGAICKVPRVVDEAAQPITSLAHIQAKLRATQPCLAEMLERHAAGPRPRRSRPNPRRGTR